MTPTPPPLKSQLRHWIRSLYPLLLERDSEILAKWAKVDYPCPRSALPTSNSSAYFLITSSDRERAKALATPGRNMYPPHAYFLQLEDTKLVQRILHLRTQISPIPAHTAWPPDNPLLPQDDPNVPRARSTEDPFNRYRMRFCRHCTPSRTDWPPSTSPGNECIHGSEMHLLLHCPHYHNLRSRLIPELNLILRELGSDTLHNLTPWSSLPDQDKLSSLLGAFPPISWGLNSENSKLWLPRAETFINQWISPIWQDCQTWLVQDISPQHPTMHTL